MTGSLIRKGKGSQGSERVHGSRESAAEEAGNQERREEGGRIEWSTEPSNRIPHVSLQTPALASGVLAQR